MLFLMASIHHCFHLLQPLQLAVIMSSAVMMASAFLRKDNVMVVQIVETHLTKGTAVSRGLFTLKSSKASGRRGGRWLPLSYTTGHIEASCHEANPEGSENYFATLPPKQASIMGL